MAPVRRAFGMRLQRFPDLVVADPGRCAEARLVIKTVPKRLRHTPAVCAQLSNLAAISLLVSPSAPARTMRLRARDRGALVCGSGPSTPVARPRPKQSQRLAPPPFSPALLIGENVSDLPTRRLANAAVHGDFSARDITGLVRGKKKR